MNDQEQLGSKLQTEGWTPSSEVQAKRRFLRELVAGSSDLTPTELGVYAIVMALIYENHGRIDYNPVSISRVLGLDRKYITRLILLLVRKRKLVLDNGKLSTFRALI